MDLEKLRESISRTLAFFDIFDQPLTKEELFRNLLITDNTDLSRRGRTPPHGGGGYSYTDFIIQLEPCTTVGTGQAFEHKDGFYFLPGREKIVDFRQLRVKLVEQKMKIAKRGIRKLAKVPFVRAVFVCNTVAMGFPDEDSDIDVLLIVKKGRIWLARFLATLFLSLFRLRRTKTKIKNRVCLSFYLADDSLNLESIAITQPDIYLIYWLDSLIPVYDPEHLRQSISRANKWIQRYLPNGLQNAEYRIWNVKCKGVGGLIKNLFEKMWRGGYGDLLEKQAKAIQRAKMKMNYQNARDAADTRVVISDSMLKFHETDRRMEYKSEWLERCKKLLE